MVFGQTLCIAAAQNGRMISSSLTPPRCLRVVQTKLHRACSHLAASVVWMSAPHAQRQPALDAGHAAAVLGGARHTIDRPLGGFSLQSQGISVFSGFDEQAASTSRCDSAVRQSTCSAMVCEPPHASSNHRRYWNIRVQLHDGLPEQGAELLQPRVLRLAMIFALRTICQSLHCIRLLPSAAAAHAACREDSRV